MSRVTIEMPSGRWFRGEWAHRPAEGELVAVLPQLPFDEVIPVHVYRYEENLLIDEIGDTMEWDEVARWMPIGMPEDLYKLCCRAEEE